MPRTTVSFRADGFNTTDVKDYFINPGCFGDDLARWLAELLRQQGLEVDADIGQEDFGWYLSYRVADRNYDLVVGYRPDDELWIAWVERALGFLGSMLGGRRKRIKPAACLAVHKALTSSGRARDVLWHEHSTFQAGNESLGTAMP
jgi:hypothetical protein